MYAEKTFAAMGSAAHVIVVAQTTALAESLVDRSQERIAELEAQWSRFVADSDVSRCNTTRGIPVDVGRDTRLLVRQAIDAWHRTDGRYDPTVFDAVRWSGYSDSFEHIATDTGAAPVGAPTLVPGCVGIEVDDELGTVRLPIEAGFDPGGIGKGLAVDLAVEELLDLGAKGALVGIGGDIRTAGPAPDGGAWGIDIVEPSVRPEPVATIALHDGAVATSTTERRVWSSGARRRHHLIDPATGDTAHASAVLASVLAADGWWAEVQATRIVLSQPHEWDEIVGADAAVVIDHAGVEHRLGRLEEFVR